MVVYMKRPDDEFYSYDIRLISGGQKYRSSGSTERTVEREARLVEKEKRLQLKQKIAVRSAVPAGKQLTLIEACDLYWLAEGKNKGHAEMIHNSIKLIAGWDVIKKEPVEGGFFEKTQLVSDINAAAVTRLMIWRKEHYRWGKKKYGKIARATVNRTTIDVLSPIMYMAQKVWEVHIVKMPEWGKLTLDEPEERIRELSDAEHDALMRELHPCYALMISFFLVTGRRKSEGILRWSQVDLIKARYTYVGKGEKTRTKPLSASALKILQQCVGHDPTWVFTYIARRTVKNVFKGARMPITNSGLTTHVKRAIARAGIVDLHPHDLRHTFATRLLRTTGNLALVQVSLDHSDPKVTRKYAHVMEQDLRNGMEATETTQPWARPA